MGSQVNELNINEYLCSINHDCLPARMYSFRQISHMALYFPPIFIAYLLIQCGPGERAMDSELEKPELSSCLLHFLSALS